MVGNGLKRKLSELSENLLARILHILTRAGIDHIIVLNNCYKKQVGEVIGEVYNPIRRGRNYRLYKIRTAPLSERSSIENYYSKIIAGVLKNEKH